MSDSNITASLSTRAADWMRAQGMVPPKFEDITDDWRKLADARNLMKRAAQACADKYNETGTPQAEADKLVEYSRDFEEFRDACDERMDEINGVRWEDPRAEAIRRDRGPNADREKGADELVGLRPEQRFADYFRNERPGDFDQFRDLSVGKYMRAMVIGPRNEVEERALKIGTDSSGGFTVPVALAAELIDLLRNQSQAIRAGSLTVPLTTTTNNWAKITAQPTPGWRIEEAAITTDDMTFGQVQLEPKSLAMIVKVTRELLQDSANIAGLLPMLLTQAMAEELDRVVLFGSGSDPEPRGLMNDASINEVAHNAEIDSYAPLLRARSKVLENNATPGAFIMNSRDEGTISRLTDTTGQPLMMPSALQGLPMLVSNKVPTDLGSGSPNNESVILHGDWRWNVIGIRNEITVTILRERYADTGHYGFLCHLRADCVRVHPEAFVKVTGVQPTA